MIRLPDKVPRLQHQRESTTPGTTSGTVESDQHDAQRHEDDQKDDQENRPRRQIVRCPEIVVAARIELAALKHRCHGTQPRHHAGAVISLPEIRQHVTHLDPLAKCIGQDAFQSRSGHEPHFPAIDDQENAQSVVRIGAADTPLGKKRMGEGEKIISANILHSDHGDLGQRPMPERIAKRVDLGDCRRGKNPVGIRREPITVADLHVGNLLHTVRPGCRTQKREQHSEAKYRQNYFFHRPTKPTNATYIICAFPKPGSHCRFAKRPPRCGQMYEKIRPIYIGRVKIRKLQPGIRSSTCEQSCTRSPVRASA